MTTVIMIMITIAVMALITIVIIRRLDCVLLLSKLQYESISKEDTVLVSQTMVTYYSSLCIKRPPVS